MYKKNDAIHSVLARDEGSSAMLKHPFKTINDFIFMGGSPTTNALLLRT